MNQGRSNEDKKFKIQQSIEKTIIKYGIDPNAFAYHIILSLSDIEKNDIFIRKKGDEISLGFVYFSLSTNGDLSWDIVMTFEYNNGFWIPFEIEDSLLKKEEWTEETFKDWIEIFKPWFDKGELKSGVYLGKGGENIHISEDATR